MQSCSKRQKLLKAGPVQLASIDPKAAYTSNKLYQFVRAIRMTRIQFLFRPRQMPPSTVSVSLMHKGTTLSL